MVFTTFLPADSASKPRNWWVLLTEALLCLSEAFQRAVDTADVVSMGALCDAMAKSAKWQIALELLEVGVEDGRLVFKIKGFALLVFLYIFSLIIKTFKHHPTQTKHVFFFFFFRVLGFDRRELLSVAFSASPGVTQLTGLEQFHHGTGGLGSCGLWCWRLATAAASGGFVFVFLVLLVFKNVLRRKRNF